MFPRFSYFHGKLAGAKGKLADHILDHIDAKRTIRSASLKGLRLPSLRRYGTDRGPRRWFTTILSQVSMVVIDAGVKI